jgi:hypothetical protein
MANETMPLEVHALQQALDQLGPNPPHAIAWRLDGAQWVVVFEDGRKLRAAASEPTLAAAGITVAYETKSRSRQKGKSK